jgi:xanthine dehydrogenase accessory factor
MLVREHEATGSVGEPPLDAAAAEAGRRVLAQDRSELVVAGDARLFAEPFAPAPALVIVGAGHVGKALAGLGRFLDLHVTVLDDRPEFATRERFPEADEVIAAPVVGETLRGLPISPRTAIVVAMRNQDLDFEGCAAALATPARYVGLIGSRRKAVLIAERLHAGGMPAERVAALRSPIGLDIGATTPAEIALAILGEWIMLRQGAPGKPLQLEREHLARAAARAGESAER